jgi:hypothetical protein
VATAGERRRALGHHVKVKVTKRTVVEFVPMDAVET